MTPPVPPNPGSTADPATDPFRYGWRQVQVTRPDGTSAFDRVPLTLEDVLHPREGDHIPENNRHERLRRHFQNVFENRFAANPTRMVFSDLLIDWDHPTVRGHAPDLIVLEREEPWPWRSWGTLHVKEEEARPLLVIEVVSPHTRSVDIADKPPHYYQVGVSIFVIVDQESEDGPLTLIGRRWTPSGYQPMELDSRGRLVLDGYGLALGVVSDRVAIYDVATDKELGDYQAVCAALKAEIKAREEAERQRDDETRARRAAEQARQAAEQARQAAEQARQAAEQARQAAEQQARDQEQAHAAAERRVKELEDLLRQMGQNPTPP